MYAFPIANPAANTPRHASYDLIQRVNQTESNPLATMFLIFDCDGVLVDSASLHAQAESKAYAEVGISISPEELNTRFSGISMAISNETLGREQGVKIPADFNKRLDATKTRLFEEKLQPIPGVFEMLEATKAWPRSIASGSNIELLNSILKITKLHDLFAPHIYSVSMVPHGNPDPDLFLLAAEKMKADPKDCVVIEDAAAGITAAKAADMRVIGFAGGSHLTGHALQALLSAGPEILCKDMKALTEVLCAIGADKP